MLGSGAHAHPSTWEGYLHKWGHNWVCEWLTYQCYFHELWLSDMLAHDKSVQHVACAMQYTGTTGFLGAIRTCAADRSGNERLCMHARLLRSSADLLFALLFALHWRIQTDNCRGERNTTAVSKLRLASE